MKKGPKIKNISSKQNRIKPLQQLWGRLFAWFLIRFAPLFSPNELKKLRLLKSLIDSLKFCLRLIRNWYLFQGSWRLKSYARRPVLANQMTWCFLAWNDWTTLLLLISRLSKMLSTSLFLKRHAKPSWLCSFVHCFEGPQTCRSCRVTGAWISSSCYG